MAYLSSQPGKTRKRQQKTKFQAAYAERKAQEKRVGKKYSNLRKNSRHPIFSKRQIFNVLLVIIIYTYSVLKQYKRTGTCKGHSSYCTHIDWSADSNYMQSNDGAYEILYWYDWDGSLARQEGKRDKCRQFCSAMDMRDTVWDMDNCARLAVQAFGPHILMARMSTPCINSNSEKYCVCGDDSFQINLFTWPALKGAYEKSRHFKGHCSHVLGLQFTSTDSHVVSVGGNDATIIEWRHFEPDKDDSKTGKNIRFISRRRFIKV